jgi:TDG/mug DNA glycosylase family protein
MKAIMKDVLAPNLSVVFCGTAVGSTSAHRHAYYAGPGNAFWKTLFEVGLTPTRFEPEQYENVLAVGLGLTGLAKIVSGRDIVLSKSHFDRDHPRRKILKFRPRIVAFVGKRAAEEFLGTAIEYGLLREKIGDSMLFVLPSPSGAARRFWNIRFWRDLARLMNSMGTQKKQLNMGILQNPQPPGGYHNEFTSLSPTPSHPTGTAGRRVKGSRTCRGERWAGPMDCLGTWRRQD